MTQPNHEDRATNTLKALAGRWEEHGLSVFELACAMFVHGAASMLEAVGPERFREAVDELKANLLEGHRYVGPPVAKPAAH